MSNSDQKKWEYVEKSDQEEQLLKDQKASTPEIDIHFDEEEAQPYLSMDKTSLIKEILTLKKESSEHWDQFVRAKAETNNVMNSAEKEKQNIRNYALKSFVQSLISVIDNFERSVEGMVADPANVVSIKEGIELTHKDFLSTLEKFGVEMLNPTGERFNPEFHEAISMQPSPDNDPNTVIQVLQKGCLLNGRLVRPAMVIVASA
ncbi:MAG: nucleotide exchange factor GrpE [Gammaproteobacteria bacterium]|nr:nucleotide exchange factor GrpE [Gammaproteobacteria bacterium]MCD8542010.1 nucleotide exchange factor GrpE [Gammaproteobacteria bacterium]